VLLEIRVKSILKWCWVLWAIALGEVVDDAIIEDTENIFRRLRENAAIESTPPRHSDCL